MPITTHKYLLASTGNSWVDLPLDIQRSGQILAYQARLDAPGAFDNATSFNLLLVDSAVAVIATPVDDDIRWEVDAIPLVPSATVASEVKILNPPVPFDTGDKRVVGYVTAGGDYKIHVTLTIELT